MDLQVAFCYSTDILDRDRSVPVPGKSAYGKPWRKLLITWSTIIRTWNKSGFGPDPVRRITRYIQDSYATSTRCAPFMFNIASGPGGITSPHKCRCQQRSCGLRSSMQDYHKLVLVWWSRRLCLRNGNNSKCASADKLKSSTRNSKAKRGCYFFGIDG